MKNVLKLLAKSGFESSCSHLLAKSVLILLCLTVWASATDAAIQTKIFWSGWTTL